MELVDIGGNLTNKAFRGDVDEVIARARAVGVTWIGVTGTSAPASRMAWELAEARPSVLFATAGVHPHHASTWNAEVEREIRELAERPEVKALGECGLDFNRNFSPREAQLAAFEAQLSLAAETAKPVFLHERDATHDFAATVARHRTRLTRAVVHCFTGAREALVRYLDLDLHIGITGWICDERRGKHLAELVKLVPRERLMIETDAPYLMPRNMPGRPPSGRNEPAFLPWVLEAVAAARGERPAEVARSTTETARAFFALPEASVASIAKG